MNYFQNSTYLNNPTLINFYFSTDLATSRPQIWWYGTGLGTSIYNFGDPSTLGFHDWIKGPSMGLQMISIGETLYYIIGHPNESTKNLKICISICPMKVSKPSFKQQRTLWCDFLPLYSQSYQMTILQVHMLLLKEKSKCIYRC